MFSTTIGAARTLSLLSWLEAASTFFLFFYTTRFEIF
jgi:hypothetical protein